jgi:hypothetical protein
MVSKKFGEPNIGLQIALCEEKKTEAEKQRKGPAHENFLNLAAACRRQLALRIR